MWSLSIVVRFVSLSIVRRSMPLSSRCFASPEKVTVQSFERRSSQWSERSRFLSITDVCFYQRRRLIQTDVDRRISRKSNCFFESLSSEMFLLPFHHHSSDFNPMSRTLVHPFTIFHNVSLSLSLSLIFSSPMISFRELRWLPSMFPWENNRSHRSRREVITHSQLLPHPRKALLRLSDRHEVSLTLSLLQNHQLSMEDACPCHSGASTGSSDRCAIGGEQSNTRSGDTQIKEREREIDFILCCF